MGEFKVQDYIQCYHTRYWSENLQQDDSNFEKINFYAKNALKELYKYSVIWNVDQIWEKKYHFTYREDSDEINYHHDCILHAGLYKSLGVY
jgi:hypothetical protein